MATAIARTLNKGHPRSSGIPLGTHGYQCIRKLGTFSLGAFGVFRQQTGKASVA
jgi:hypothetical protein